MSEPRLIRRCVFPCLFLALAILLNGASGHAQQVVPPAPPQMTPPAPPPQMTPAGGMPAIRMVAPGMFEIGGCTIDKAANRVTFAASVNMTEGLLEYALVGMAGKLHESLLRTEVEPYPLQIALLLMGLEGSPNHLAFQGENKMPEGDAVRVRVALPVKEGKAEEIPIENWIMVNEARPGDIPWIFTGSMINNGVFAAQMEKSIIAVYHDPAAMIDHRRPGGESDEVWFVNKQAVPPVGTPVTVIIEKITK
ncbi:MAG: YdjY domain-containing protein [Thermodesulfobacteriota bacterium]